MFLPSKGTENRLVRTQLSWWTDGDQSETVARETLLYAHSSGLGRGHQPACPLLTPLLGLSVAQVLFLSLSLYHSLIDVTPQMSAVTLHQ